MNPYGSVYPEVDIEKLTVFYTLLHYVARGGIVVNVADIPFFWAYDPKRDIRYELWKRPQAPYEELPFARVVRVRIISTEPELGRPIKCRLVLKDHLRNMLGIEHIDNVAVNRAAILGEEVGRRHYIQSIIEPIELKTIEGTTKCTPLCYIYFGKGKFIVSTLFLGYHEQPLEVREKIVELLCSLIVLELKRDFTSQ